MIFYFSYGLGRIESTLCWDFTSFDNAQHFLDQVWLDVLHAGKALTCFDDAVCLANEAQGKAEAWLDEEWHRLFFSMESMEV